MALPSGIARNKENPFHVHAEANGSVRSGWEKILMIPATCP